MFYDLRHLVDVGRFDGNNELDNLRRNVMHAHGRNLPQFLESGKEVFRELTSYRGSSGKTPTIDICYNALERIRQLHYMDQDSFEKMLMMAYEIVRDNSRWLLKQR